MKFVTALSVLISGFLVDRLPIGKLMGVGLFVSGVSAIALGACQSLDSTYVPSLVITIIISIATGPAFVTNLTVIGQWFPRHGRGLIMAFWMWQEPVGDIWGGVLFRVMSGKNYETLGVPLYVIGSVAMMFGTKNFFILAQSPEYKGFKIEEDQTLRDQRAILRNLSAVEKVSHREDIVK